MKTIMALKNKLFLNIIMGFFMIRMAFAEDTVIPPAGATEPPAGTAPAPTISIEQLLAQVRAEEKNKLYPQIEKLKAEKETLTKKLNEALLQAGEREIKVSELTKDLDKAQKGKVEPEEIKTLKATIATLEGELATIKAESSKKALEDFKARKLLEVNNEVIPDLVTGTTEEEISASIVIAQAKYKEIADVIKAKAGVPAINVNPNMPPANPNTQTFTMDLATVTDEQIRNMSTAEYKEYRKKLGL